MKLPFTFDKFDTGKFNMLIQRINRETKNKFPFIKNFAEALKAFGLIETKLNIKLNKNFIESDTLQLNQNFQNIFFRI